MNKKESKYLMHKLPDYSPSDKVWEKIEEQLNYFSEKTNIQKSLHKLPQYNAPDKIWNKIENQLQQYNKKNIQLYILKVAAVFILITGLTVIIKYYLSNDFTNYHITYETATISDSDEIINSSFNYTKIDNSELLAEQCKNYPKICNNENYIELNDLYQKIILEEEGLNKQLEKFNDPNIKNYLIKLESEKAKVEKYMLEIFTK